jgi:ATP-dependent DNA helicase PIF1
LPVDETRRSFQPCVGRKLDSSDGILPTRIFTHRKDVDTLNAKELQQLRGDSVEYKAVDSGEPQYLRSLQMNCPAKQILKLKVGAQVILVKTIDAKEGLVNGARGVVMKFTRYIK